MARQRRAPIAADGHGVAVELPPEVRAVVQTLVSETIELLGPEPDDPLAAALDTSPVERPDDPSLHRLLPDGYAADVDGGQAASEFRRITDGDLRASKRADAHRLLATITDTSLSLDDAEAWARALNDVRLVLGARLGLEADGDAEERHDAAEAAGRVDPVLEIYELLGLLQTLLVDALDEIAPV